MVEAAHSLLLTEAVVFSSQGGGFLWLGMQPKRAYHQTFPKGKPKTTSHLHTVTAVTHDAPPHGVQYATKQSSC